jgi:hypothetical protein
MLEKKLAKPLASELSPLPMNRATCAALLGLYATKNTRNAMSAQVNTFFTPTCLPGASDL